ncbi:MAG: hypothetical protein WAN48_13770 [Actinomycetes bacterium]
MTRLMLRLHARLSQLRDDDRGDVPGWVFITIMTAGLVTTLWLVAEDQLREIFSSALSRVSR